MNLRQFRYAADNLGYLIYGKRHAIAVDGGAVDEILAFLDAHRLKLVAVTNTHTHPDHTSGNTALIRATGATLAEPLRLARAGKLELEGTFIQVRHTPGHSSDSVVFHHTGVLLSGDTLFIGRVGRCFTGDRAAFLSAIQWILSLPDQTLVYPGHDYVHEYLTAAKVLEPANLHIDRFLDAYHPDHVVSTLSRERKINLTLRFNDPDVIALLSRRGLAHATEYERWNSVLSLVHE